MDNKFRTTAAHAGGGGCTLGDVRTTTLGPEQVFKAERSLQRWGRIKPGVLSPTVHDIKYCSSEWCMDPARRMVNRDGNPAWGNILQRLVNTTLGAPPPPYLDQALCKAGGRVRKPSPVWLAQ